MEIGLHKNVPFETYRSWPEINNSALSCLAPPDGCPALLKHDLDHPSERTDAMKVGEAFHCRTLQTSMFEDQFVIAGKCRHPKKDGEPCFNPGKALVGGKWLCGVHTKVDRHVAAFAAAGTNLAASGCVLEKTSEFRSQYWRHPKGHLIRVADHAPTGTCAKRMRDEATESIRVDIPPYGSDDPRTILSEAERELINGMRDAVLNKPAAARLLAMPGDVELSGVFIDIDTGVRCKLRIDKLIQGEIDGQPFIAVVDLKKTAKAVSPEQLKYTIRNYGYDRQAAFYLHGLAALQIYAEHFIFIFVQEEPPHLVTVGRIKERALEKARRQIVEDLITYKECRESGLWPDYGSEIVTLDVPDYEYRKEQA